MRIWGYVMGEKGNQPPEKMYENVNRLMEEGDDIRRMIRKPTVEAPLKDHKQATIGQIRQTTCY